MKSQKQQEAFVLQTLKKGFDVAADSFSKIINRSVKINASALAMYNANQFSYASEGNQDVYVLVTQLMGDFGGKSYLIIPFEDAEEIFNSVFQKKNDNVPLNEALLLEIDNILSASVISAISNEVKAMVYGDVPKLKKMKTSDLKEFLHEEKDTHESYNVIYSVAAFKFDGREKFRPQFIWKLSSRIFDLIPEDKVATA